MVTKVKEQIHMEEHFVGNPELEQLLEEREDLKASVSEYRKTDKEVKEKIASTSEVTPYRIGRFVIDKKPIAAKSVSFETAPSERYSIKIAGED